MHPILDALDKTPHEWIKKLLFTFNEGNIGKFEALAPLFPREVRTVTAHHGYKSNMHSYLIAYPSGELRISETKDMPNGAYRICV